MITFVTILLMASTSGQPPQPIQFIFPGTEPIQISHDHDPVPQPPPAPATEPPPAHTPRIFRYADVGGQSYEFHDEAYLKAFLAGRNSTIALPVKIAPKPATPAPAPQVAPNLIYYYPPQARTGVPGTAFCTT